MAVSVTCFDCAMFRGAYDVDCIKHTPEYLRGAREMRIREATRVAMAGTNMMLALLRRRTK